MIAKIEGGFLVQIIVLAAFGALLMAVAAVYYYLIRRWTDPIHWAVERGRVDLLRKLIAKGGNPNAKNGEACTPLHVAVDAGDLEVVRLLLDSHVDVNCTNKAGKTPLDLANGDPRKAAIAEVLLAYGGVVGKEAR